MHTNDKAPEGRQKGGGATFKSGGAFFKFESTFI